jgi:hypothetical protein
MITGIPQRTDAIAFALLVIVYFRSSVIIEHALVWLASRVLLVSRCRLESGRTFDNAFNQGSS